MASRPNSVCLSNFLPRLINTSKKHCEPNRRKSAGMLRKSPDQSCCDWNCEPSSFNQINYDSAVRHIRQRSCKRRSAKLNDETKRQIIQNNSYSRRLKLENYYEKLQKKKAKELDIETRKAMAKNRFTRVVWTVVWIIRCKRAMIEISLGNMVMTAIELDWHTRHMNDRVSQFRKEDYSRQKVFTRVPMWARKILHKPPEWRNTSDCHKLHTLLRSLKSFEKFTEKIQMAMCKAMHYEYVNAKRIILRKGQPGVCFYFIYCGSVFVNTEDTDSNGVTFFKTTAILHSGDSFGELALLQNIERAATITCREDVELLTVDAGVFASVCPAIFEEELQEKINFIKSLSIFMPRLWAEEDIETICSEAQIKQYRNNKVIVADNRADEWIYICIEGKCKVFKCIHITNNDGNQRSFRIRSNSEVHRKNVSSIFEKMTANVLTNKQYSEPDQDCKHNPQLPKTADPQLPKTADPQLPKTADSVNFKANAGKVKMLSSMALEWLRAHEQIEEMKRKNRTNTVTANNEISGMKSFTSLMVDTIQQANQDGSEVVFLEVAQLSPHDIFDLNTIFHSDEECTHSGNPLVLVSSGAKMLRIKKCDFFRVAKYKILEQIRAATEDQDVYHDDCLLFAKYQDVYEWEKFKTNVIKEITEAKGDVRDRIVQDRIDHTDKCLQREKLIKSIKYHNQRAALERSNAKEVKWQRDLFQFEVDKIVKKDQEEIKRDIGTYSARAYHSNTFKLHRTRRVSAVLPNIFERLVLETAVSHIPRD